MPRREPPSVALGALPSAEETEDPPGPAGMDKMCHATTACALQQAHMNSVLMLEHETKWRRDGITEPSWRHSQWPYKPAHPRPGGYSCSPYSS